MAEKTLPDIWKTGAYKTNTTVSKDANPDPYAAFQPTSGASPTSVTDPNAVLLFEMTPQQRKEIANLLKSAGYNVPTDGRYNDRLIAAYSDASQKTAIQSQRLGRAFTVREYLTQEKVQDTAGDPSISNYISDPTQAAATINNVFQSVLGREASDKEIKNLTTILVDAQKRNPYKVTDGVRTGGLDDQQFIKDLIKTGTYAANKKLSPGILGNLAKEYEKRGGEKEELLKQDILETARANAVALSDVQVSNFLKDIKGGQDIRNVQQRIRNIGYMGMPDSLKQMASEGVDLEVIYSPYKSRMASILEVNPETISLNDPTLRAAIGPEKEMPLYEFERALRKDVRWQYTNQAREEVAAVANKVLRDFGFQG